MKPHAITAIAMGPNKNMQGGVSFLSLTTGWIINKNGTDFTPLPMPHDAVDRVAYWPKMPHHD